MDGQITPQQSKERLNNTLGQEQIATPAGFEVAPDRIETERPLEVGQETEQSIVQHDAQPTVAPPVVTPVQPLPTVTPSDDQTGEVTETLPSVAGHGDKIEREWVAMGEKIIAQTKDNPRDQKDKIDNLRDAYQSARYGVGKG